MQVGPTYLLIHAIKLAFALKGSEQHDFDA